MGFHAGKACERVGLPMRPCIYFEGSAASPWLVRCLCSARRAANAVLVHTLQDLSMMWRLPVCLHFKAEAF